MSAKDVEWQVRFEELAEQVAKLWKARCLDAESMTEVNTRIASHLSTALPVREKVAEAASQALPPSPPTSGYRVRDPSLLPPPEHNDGKGRPITPPRC
jgi:hypothetical protein